MKLPVSIQSLSAMILSFIFSQLSTTSSYLPPVSIPKFTSQQFVKKIIASSCVGLSTASIARATSSTVSNVKNRSLSASSSYLSVPTTQPLNDEAYTMIGDMKSCKLLNGMWQVSGGIHGFQPYKEIVVAKMAEYADHGYNTFDLADIYGPAEDYVGLFRKGSLSSSLSPSCNFYTKWVPTPTPDVVTKKLVYNAIGNSLDRMRTDRIDLLQFHWWDYENRNYYDTMHHLIQLHEEDKIRNIGLCNFDTEHMVDLIEEDAPIVTNQVSFSILDTRPQQTMIPTIKEKNLDVKLLVYGTLLGGFLSSYWLNKPEPSVETNTAVATNVSLRKYLPWINYWGGWELFQELLRAMDSIGKKHMVSISNVALRYVLDEPTVGGAIVGVRFGYERNAHDHFADNQKIFQFRFDDEDKKLIKDLQSRGNNLYKVFGDCGGEYRRRPSRSVRKS